VWPFLVRTVTVFQGTLRPREQASFDPEDVLLELWAKIAEKDHKWEPERGEYISYVGSIVETELHRLRDRTKTVRSPGNSAARLREYEARETAGTITPGQKKTAEDMRRVTSSQSFLAGSGDEGRDCISISIVDRAPAVEEVAFRREAAGTARVLLVRGLSALSPYEAKILGQAYGLWGQPIRTHGSIAKANRRSVVTIRKQIAVALAKCNNALGDVAA
jgi:hypothetical protein